MTEQVPSLPAGPAAERRGPVAVLRLNRPHKRNALSDEAVLDIEHPGRGGGAAVGFSRYVVDSGRALEKAVELAERAAETAPLTTSAVLHALPCIAEADPRIGGLIESLMAAIASGDKDAKVGLRAFLEGRAAKVAHG